MSEARLAVSDQVATITLDAPQRRNAITVAMANEIIAAVDEIDARNDVGALVVRAEGTAFCAGADLALLRAAGHDPAGADAYDAMDRVYQSFIRVGACRVPSIAAVRGSAVGAGFNLVLATDLRIIAGDARLMSGFLKRGLHPGGGHFTILNRLAGREATAAMSLFGEEIDGKRAHALGLAWDAPAAADVEERAMQLARKVAVDPALSRMAVASFRQELRLPIIGWDVASQLERPSQMWSLRRAAAASG